MGRPLKTEQAAQPGNDGLVLMPDGVKFVSSVRLGGISLMSPRQACATDRRETSPTAASMCYDASANQLVVPMNANNGLAFIPLKGIWTPAPVVFSWQLVRIWGDLRPDAAKRRQLRPHFHDFEAPLHHGRSRARLLLRGCGGATFAGRQEQSVMHLIERHGASPGP